MVKAVGGKAKLRQQLLPLLPALRHVTGYREPFVGGGALFFLHFATVRPSVLSDANERLITAYLAVRDCVEDVIGELRCLPHNEDVYYRVRERFNQERDAPIAERAAWFIYLSRTCVNGLFRENLAGEFNVGRGAYDNPRICDAVNLRACSVALRGVELRCCDFDVTLTDIRAGEMVVLDPPYIPLPGKPSFTKYLGGGFSSVAGTTRTDLAAPRVTDHERLAAAMRRIDDAGAYFVACNSDTAEARRVYAGWPVATIKAARSINSDGAGRGKVSELVFSNAARWRS